MSKIKGDRFMPLVTSASLCGKVKQIKTKQSNSKTQNQNPEKSYYYIDNLGNSSYVRLKIVFCVVISELTVPDQ